jgi:hypothetical protein
MSDKTAERTQILLKGLRFARAYGDIIGHSGMPSRLVEPTAEIKAEIRRKRLLSEMASVDWNRLTTEQLEAIYLLTEV